VTPGAEPEIGGTADTGRHRTLFWSGLVVVAAAGGIAFGALWRRPVQPVERQPVITTPAAAPALALPAPSAEASAAAAPGAAETPSESLVDRATPTVHSPTAPIRSDAGHAAAALPVTPVDPPRFENVVARVMPAIVLVEAGGSRGSGFFVAPDTLLTNVHVVGRSSSVTVRRASGDVVPARVEATAPQVDIAVLKLSVMDKAQPTLALGSTGNVRIGQEVFAIGSALGVLQNTLTRGIVSGIRQTPNATLVQTDAAVNPGNSGGPLLDQAGRVVGIVTMGFTERQGLNFAVGIDHARALLEGRPAQASPVAPSAPAAAMRGLSPSLPSETDRTRTEGARMYEQAIAQLARRADTLENAWRQYGASCYKGRAAAGLERDWFTVFTDRSTAAIAPGCDRWFADFRRQAGEVAAGVVAAEELARQADVYPGVRRDARRRHRLDYPGWER
jgi:S1-C subfamily serine protease